MLGIEPAWMQEERPAYWMIGLPGDRNLELFADVFRRLGFLFGKMPGDKGRWFLRSSTERKRGQDK